MFESQERPWFASYPAGLPHEIEVGPYQSIPDLIAATCKRHAGRVAFSNMGQSLTFTEVDELSTQVASFFRHELGLQSGERIVLMMPNLLQYPVAFFGALKAGLIVVNINPLYTPHEMQKVFADSEPLAIVALNTFADKVEQVLPSTTIRHVVLTSVGDLFSTAKRFITTLGVKYVRKMVPAYHLPQAIEFRDVISRGKNLSTDFPKIGRDDVALLQYTGGTTGGTKAAMLSHGNILANQAQMIALMKSMFKEGEEVVIAALPMYHVFCLTVNCLGLFCYGSHNVLITNPRDVPGFVKTLEGTRPTMMIVVSTLASALLENKEFRLLDFSRLKASVAGGMALKTSVAQEWLRVTGTRVVEGYGLTEASPVVACNPLGEANHLGTIGLPLPSTDLQIRDEDGQVVAPGETGELMVFGPQVMQGYWKQPEETANVLGEDGWLRTGDLAVMDPDGYFRIVDRKKDMILVSGFNVFPNEIDDAVMLHPKVLEVAAIGIPDEHSGEVVKIFVVKRDPSLTEDELKAHCRTELAAYKCPKVIEFCDELPKSNVGKVLRRTLREREAKASPPPQ